MISLNGIDKLLAPMQLTAWRAPMDNDSKMKVNISCKDNELVMKIEFGFNISC